jgi:hypothetical protein
MTKDVIGLYKEYFIDRDFERLDLFELLQEKFNIESAIYPGSFVHVTPSFVYPKTTYIDSDKNAKRFFEHPEFIDFIISHKKYQQDSDISFYPKDFQGIIEWEKGKYDLLVSQYAGFVSMHCKEYLKIGGILLANNSHGDASMASIDKDYEFVGIMQKSKGKY